MKKIRANIDRWLEGLDKSWEQMPLVKQHNFILYFFSGYVMLTAVVIFNVCYTSIQRSSDIEIRHIETPAVIKKETLQLQDSINNTKKEDYERK